MDIRNAEPLDGLKKMHALLLEQMPAIVQEAVPEPKACEP